MSCLFDSEVRVDASAGQQLVGHYGELLVCELLKRTLVDMSESDTLEDVFSTSE